MNARWLLVAVMLLSMCGCSLSRPEGSTARSVPRERCLADPHEAGQRLVLFCIESP